MRSAQFELSAYHGPIFCKLQRRASLTGIKWCRPLGPAGEPVEPKNWGPLLLAAPLGVEAQRDRQPIGCVLTGAWQGGVSVRSDQTRPPCMGAATSAHGQRAMGTASDWKGKFYRETGWPNHGSRHAGRYSGFRPEKRHLGSATQMLLAMGTAHYRGDGTSGQQKSLSVWTTANANAANRPRRPDRMIACQNMS